MKEIENEVKTEKTMTSDVSKTLSEEKDTTFESIETNVRPVQTPKSLKITIAWFVYFALGILISLAVRIVPPQVSLNIAEGVALKMILTFLCLSAMKYIGIFSVVCMFFTVKRKESPKYFSFIFGFYTLLLILSVIGVVF